MDWWPPGLVLNSWDAVFVIAFFLMYRIVSVEKKWNNSRLALKFIGGITCGLLALRVALNFTGG